MSECMGKIFVLFQSCVLNGTMKCVIHNNELNGTPASKMARNLSELNDTVVVSKIIFVQNSAIYYSHLVKQSPA